VNPELRTRVRSGDEQAFGELYDAFHRAVYNHAFRLTGDWSAAEDVMSLTFLEAWRMRDRVDPDGDSLRPWLLGIATNVAYNQNRSARRHRDAMARVQARGAPVSPDFADDIAGRIDDAQRIAATRAAWHKLRRPEQEVLSLFVWAGLNYAEVAEALGIPVGTVRSRLSRARTRLHTLTEKHLEPPGCPRKVTGSRDYAARSPQSQQEAYQ
jgi:RNA polymerase sigma factor (sigma-70 family)